jgi:hypothetical protein
VSLRDQQIRVLKVIFSPGRAILNRNAAAQNVLMDTWNSRTETHLCPGLAKAKAEVLS